MGTNETTLKPCPFCGAEPIMRTGGRGGFWALCERCGAQLRMSDTKSDAVRNWNRRAKAGRTSDELEDAVRIMRAAQKEYFRTRAPSALCAAKQSERAVDVLLDKADEEKDNAGKPRQGELL